MSEFGGVMILILKILFILICTVGCGLIELCIYGLILILLPERCTIIEGINIVMWSIAIALAAITGLLIGCLYWSLVITMAIVTLIFTLAGASFALIFSDWKALGL